MTDVVFAFRCETVEDRVFDQRTVGNEDRLFDRGTIEDKDRVVDQRASGQSTKAPEAATKEPGQSGVRVWGRGLPGCFRVVQNVSVLPKMDVFPIIGPQLFFARALV